MIFFPSFCAVYTWRGKEKKKKKREFFSSYHSTCDSDGQRRETDTNQFVVVTMECIAYLEIIRNCPLLLAGCSGNAAWISLSPALIPIVEWEANGVQLLFPEWNQFAISFDILLFVHP